MVQLFRIVLAVIGALVALPLMAAAVTYGFHAGALSRDVQESREDDRTHRDDADEVQSYPDTYRYQPTRKPGQPMLDPKPALDPSTGEYRRY